MFVVDSNVYIEASANPVMRSALHAFLVREARQVRLSTVVLHELLVGASTSAARASIVRDVAHPFGTSARLVETDALVWQEAGVIVARLRARGGLDDKLKVASFRHDILIAASCRRIGATLITGNVQDFALINSARGFRYTSRFPE